MRSKIRIRDGRAKPIDLLAQYVNPEEDNLEFQMHEPYSVLVVCHQNLCYMADYVIGSKCC